jgi:hypothetical protein
MKRYIVTKLDRRHNGAGLFSHYITPVFQTTLADKLEFLEYRKWCWATWGPGMESEWAIEIARDRDQEVKWAWLTEYKQKRIYFRTEKELNWFNMRWMS